MGLQFDRMMAGEWYLPTQDPDIHTAYMECQRKVSRFNATTPDGDPDNDPDDAATRTALLHNIFGEYGEGSIVRQPLTCECGVNVRIGRECFLNFDVMFVDTNTVTLGDNVQVGPRVQFVTPLHPVDDVEMRAAGWERSAPITVGNNVWIAAGVTVCAGVTIGDNSVIGAGSVVTKDIPANVLAVGTPCRPVRTLRTNTPPAD